MMSIWWQNHSPSLGLALAAGLAAAARAVQGRAQAMTSASTRRRAQERIVRLITVVAGH